MSRTLSVLLGAFSFFVINQAIAEAPASCLQRASDQQLLDEVAYRMGSGGGNTGPGAQVLATCDGSTYLHVTVTNLDTGTEDKKSWHTGSSSLCDAAIQLVQRKTGGTTIFQNLMIGFCDGSTYFHRILLKANGEIQDMGSQHMGSRSNCEAAMNQL
ncbi:MAG: hypothetical protein H6624_08665 [Bdellovibrionaceae bacterium]|nr:hypothetical protein [Bdellovibrionales bacterium]MCB9084404.1 hypothetical protein [Pseudobdellovibrionaceae bacterium]